VFLYLSNQNADAAAYEDMVRAIESKIQFHNLVVNYNQFHNKIKLPFLG
jgi:hypothetical protein